MNEKPAAETDPPSVLAFEGRCYRLDRVSSTRQEDVRVVREKDAPVTSHEVLGERVDAGN